MGSSRRRGSVRALRVAPLVGLVLAGAMLAAPATAAGERPQVTERPAISGTAQPGETLTATTGSWTGDPTSYAVQWQACTGTGPSLACEVFDADPDGVALGSEQLGARIRVRVTATNAVGSSATLSRLTAVVGAPARTARPSLTGTAAPGRTLTASRGAWLPGAGTFEYAWQSCSDGACTDLDGDQPTLELTQQEVGTRVRARVVATNPVGSTTAYSPLSKTVGTPTNTGRPTLEGIASPGETITADRGTWLPDADAFEYAWETCSGGACTTLAGALPSLELTQEQVGSRVRVRVTAENVHGRSVAYSKVSSVVGLPVNTTLPSITGTPQVAQTLSADHGTWTDADSFAYAWQSCTDEAEIGSCTPVGADQDTYTPTAAEAGTRIRVLVTASNTVGSTESLSLPTAAVTAPAAPADRVEAGQFHTCGITSTQTVRCWGDDFDGQSTVPADLGTVTQVSAGGYHTCALTTAGDVRCWGADGSGQSTVPTDLGAVTQISAGGYHTCALTRGGDVICWGYGAHTVPSDLGVVTQISSGDLHGCARTSDGTARCWGYAADGRTDVPADLGSVLQVSAGLRHSCAVTTSGAVRCWGNSDLGQADVPALGTAVQVSTGSYHTCALTSAGAVRCWGDEGSGQTTVPALGTVSQISAGGYHSCARTTAGTTRCWGYNEGGQTVVPAGLDAGPAGIV